MRYFESMASRTTLALDEDVLATARARAERERRSLGDIVSELARKGMERDTAPLTTRNGIPQLPRRGAVITPELVNALRDEEE